MSQKHKFKIENTVYEWPNQFITGNEVREVGAGIPESMDIFLKISGQVGRLVANDEKNRPGPEAWH